MAKISPMSVVDPAAVLAEDVEVGPFCVVGPKVKLGAGNRLISHVVLTGHTTVGCGNIFYPHCVVGEEPQDKKYGGGDTRLEIGDHNVIREHVTIHTGTEKGGSITRIGSQNLLMINVHVAHDVQMGDCCILANGTMLAGHVVLGNHVNMMGMVGVHHWVSIGDHAYVTGLARIRKDVPPYCKVDDKDQIRALNKEGLKRCKFAAGDIEELETAFRRLFNRDVPLATVMETFEVDGLNPHVRKLLEFLRRRNLGKHGRYLEGHRPPERLSSR